MTHKQKVPNLNEMFMFTFMELFFSGTYISYFCYRKPKQLIILRTKATKRKIPTTNQNGYKLYAVFDSCCCTAHDRDIKRSKKECIVELYLKF